MAGNPGFGRDASSRSTRMAMPRTRVASKQRMRRVKSEVVSIKVIKRVLEAAIRPVPKFVLVVLADYADDDGNNVYPSVETVIRRTGWSKATVHRALVVLRRAGVLIFVRAAAQHHPPIYRIDVAALERLTRAAPQQKIGYGPRGVEERPLVGARGGGVTPLQPCQGSQWDGQGSPSESPEVSDRDPIRQEPLEEPLEARQRRLPAKQVAIESHCAPRRPPAIDVEWPEDFVLTADLAHIARKYGCENPDLAFEDFHQHSIAKGTTHKNWPAAWRRWCMHHGHFGCPCQRNGGQHGRTGPRYPESTLDQLREKDRATAASAGRKEET